jgi:predicted  nucleic acid-binding Zn-ribbon protein
MKIVEHIEELGIDLSEEEKELITLDEMLMEAQDENAKLNAQVKRLKNELENVKEERDELKEALCEVDPDFADVVSGSDRGYEMRHD